MVPLHLRIGALAVAGIIFSTVPSFAERDGRRHGDGGSRRSSVQHAQPRGASQRAYVARRPVEVVRPYSYGYRPYGYGYRSYARPYVVPYGYRPYGYGPGWSLNLYFGRPYAAYGYPAYGYPGYSAGSYGYFAIAPGRAYGSVRIVDAPPDAQVFVDGYYAGVVDDYDGVFQHLNLEAGPHHIEIEVPGYPRTGFDIRVEPGRTITYRAAMP